MQWFIKALVIFFVTSGPALTADFSGDQTRKDKKQVNIVAKKTKRKSPKQKASQNVTFSVPMKPADASTHFKKNPLQRTSSQDIPPIKTNKLVKRSSNIGYKPNTIEITTPMPFICGQYVKPESDGAKLDELSKPLSLDDQTVKKFLEGLGREKNDQIVRLLFDGVEGGSPLVVQKAYEALIQNGYDIAEIAKKHGIILSDIAQINGHDDMAKFLKAIEDYILSKTTEGIMPTVKLYGLKHIIEKNDLLISAISASSHKKNFNLVYDELSRNQRITDVNFSYKIYEALLAYTDETKILPLKRKKYNEKIDGMSKFKGTYLYQFYDHTLGKHHARLLEIKKEMTKAKVVEAKKFLEDNEFLTAKETWEKDRKVSVAAKLLLAEQIFDDQVIEFLKKEISDENIALIQALMDDETLMNDADQFTDKIEIEIPKPIEKILEAGAKIDDAKEFLRKNRIDTAEDYQREAEKLFPIVIEEPQVPTWDKLWERFDKKMSESFNWKVYSSAGCSDSLTRERASFRITMKNIFGRLSLIEKKEDRSQKEPMIDWQAAWFLLNKEKLLTYVPTKNSAENILLIEDPEGSMAKQKELNENFLAFNKKINTDDDFFRRLKEVDLKKLRAQKNLLMFALEDENWQFFNIRRLLNQLFFPSPEAPIVPNIFLDRPLFKGDEKFADLF